VVERLLDGADLMCRMRASSLAGLAKEWLEMRLEGLVCESGMLFNKMNNR
jgi:hypothetical protein